MFNWGDDETQGYHCVCGLGAELALVLAPVMWMWRRRNGRA
jgi:hypothetical protein